MHHRIEFLLDVVDPRANVHFQMFQKHIKFLGFGASQEKNGFVLNIPYNAAQWIKLTIF